MYLGLRWQSNGKWDQHVINVLDAARRMCAMICSVFTKNAPSFYAVRQLAHALIRSRFAYGMPIWSPSNQQQWSQLDAAVAEPMRRWLQLPKSTHVQSLLIESSTLPT